MSSRILLFVTAAALLYGSLYPFHFTRGHTQLLRWVAPPGLSAIRDYVLNIAIYLPLGFLLTQVLPGRPAWRVGGAVGLSCLFSGSIEIVQAFDRGRVSSLIDLLLNTIGGGAGALAAASAGRRFGSLARFYCRPSPALLAALALAAHLYPFFPSVYRDLLKARVIGLGRPFPAEDLLFAAVEWLAFRVLLTRIWGTPKVTAYLAVATLSVPAGLLIIDQPVTAAGLLGALLAIGIGHFWNPAPFALAPWVLAAVVGRELAPFHFSSPPRPFSWVPFSGFLESMPGSMVILFQKLFLYGTAVWMLDEDSRRPMAVGGAVAALVGVLEWAQRWLPGRTPEVTDALLVLLMSGLLYCLSCCLPGKLNHKQDNRMASRPPRKL